MIPAVALRVCFALTVAMVLGVWLAPRLREHPRVLKVAILLPFLTLAALLARSTGYLGEDSLHELTRYAQLWSVPCLGGVVLFTLLLARPWAKERGQKIVLLTASLAFAVLFALQVREVWPVTPGPPSLRNGAILQSTPFSCSAASAANFLVREGRQVTEADLVKAAGTTRSGTTRTQLIIAMQNYGYRCRVEHAVDASVPTAPAFLVVDHPATGPNSHMILLEQRDADRLTIVDPLVGRSIRTLDQLRDRFHGVAIRCASVGDPYP